MLAGWQVGGIYHAQTGTPFSVVLNNDRAGSKTDTTGASLGQRPNLVAGPDCTSLTNPGNPNNYVKTGCFTFPPVGILGNLGRNTLTAPGISNLDFSLFRNLRFTERSRSQVRLEVFNAFNHANFSAPAYILFDLDGNLISTAGLITSTNTTSRQIQFGLKIGF